MPVCNAGDALHACLRSMLQQDYRAFELIAIDDHSQDSSLKSLRDYAKHDARIKIYPNRGRGLVDALNTGLALAQYDLVARMDADDVMLPERLRRQVSVLQQYRELDLLACRVHGFSDQGLRAGYVAYLDWQNRLLSHTDLCAQMYVESPLAHPSVMFRRDKVQALGGYQHGDFPEDYQLWLRMMQHGCRFAKLPHYMLYWRDSAQRTSRTDARYASEKFAALRVSYLKQDARLPKQRPLWFWGAGRRTRQRIKGLIEEGVTPSAWIDIDPKKIGQRVLGKPVYSPQALRASEKPYVLVLVNNHGAKALIAKELHKLGFHSEKDYLLFG